MGNDLLNLLQLHLRLDDICHHVFKTEYLEWGLNNLPLYTISMNVSKRKTRRNSPACYVTIMCTDMVYLYFW